VSVEPSLSLRNLWREDSEFPARRRKLRFTQKAWDSAQVEDGGFRLYLGGTLYRVTKWN